MIESADSDYLLPEWVMFVGSAMARRLCCLTSAIIPQSIRSRLEIRPFSEGVSVSENPKHDPFTLLSSSGALGESVAGLLYRQYKNQRTENVIARAIQEPPRERKDLSDEEVASMLSYFEKLFFEVDSLDASGFINMEECEALLSYTALDIEPTERAQVFKNHDHNGSGLLNRVEFCQLCFNHLWNVPFQRLDHAVESLKNAHSGPARRNVARWQRVARRSDMLSRTVIPALYVLALIVVFAVDFSDNYEEPGAEMFSGLGSVSMSYQGACILGIYCAGVVISVIAWWATAEMSARQAAQRGSAFKQAVAASSKTVLLRRATSNALPAAAGMYVVDARTDEERSAWADSADNQETACRPCGSRSTHTRVMPISTSSLSPT